MLQKRKLIKDDQLVIASPLNRILFFGLRPYAVIIAVSFFLLIGDKVRCRN